MAESSAVPALPGLVVEVVEWLPSGAESGLVRVRGRWAEEAARKPGLPSLALRAQGAEHRFESLPDARFSRDPASWRGTYLVPTELVAADPEALWLEWPGGVRAGLPAPARGAEAPPVPAAPKEPEDAGGQVIERAVLADLRARRAEAAEQAQARKAAEALKAVEVLELRSAELERRLEEADAERAAHGADDAGRGEALAAALASAAELRSRAREWQLRMRVSEIARGSDAVRLAILEAERAGGVAAMRAAMQERTAELEAARREATERAAELEAANEAAAAARASLSSAQEEWARRREELQRALSGARAELARARGEAERASSLEAALTAAEGRARTAETALAAAESRLRTEAVARATLEDELDRARARGETLRSELEAERAARRTAEDALRDAERAELRRHVPPGAGDLDRLAGEQAAAAAARQPPAGTDRVVSDIAAAAEALRRGAATTAEPPASDTEPSGSATNPGSDPEAAAADPEDQSEAEPAAPDAEPAVEWGAAAKADRRPVTRGVEPRRTAGDAERRVAWAPPRVTPATEDHAEPPAPDAEPFVESAPPPNSHEQAVEPPAAAESPAAGVESPAGGPRIVSAAKPPARGLMIGTERRDYPLLRGAIVKLAHDDPRLAGRLLASLLPAQGAAVAGPLAYDLTIAGTGTFGVRIVGGRASVEPLGWPRARRDAEFHLRADPLVLAEMLAGVQHRVGRFFGPVRVRGRKRRVKALRPLASSTASLAVAARAGARLDPELVYRTIAYAVHPSWTRGHSFTIAQELVGDPPETWYLTARDGAGLAVSAAASGTEPAATVSMTRDVFDRLIRGEPVAGGERPSVRGDREAVELMRAWTRRAQGVE